jgi:photosystem II stability/assembly factor-like uncharacterized protein
MEFVILQLPYCHLKKEKQMRNIFYFILAIFFLFTSITSLHAQWIQTNGPLTGGTINGLAIIDKNLFASTDGVFRSTDNGTSWKSVMTSNNVFSIYAYGTSLFAGTNGSGVYFSIDNGANWTSLTNHGLTSNFVFSFAFCPNKKGGTNMFVGSSDQGVFLSTDNGTSWINTSDSGLPVSYINSLCVSGACLFVSNSWYGIYRSTNNGTSWIAVNNGIPPDEYGSYPSIRCFGVSGTKIFAVTERSGSVYFSTNQGNSWGNCGLSCSIYSLIVSDATIAAGSVDSIFISSDNGTTWNTVRSGLTNTMVSSIAISGTNYFAAGYEHGIVLSTDKGANWRAATPFVYDGVNCLAVNGINLLAGGEHGVFLSTNDGISWSFNGLGGLVRKIIVNDTNIFVGNGEIFLSSNNNTSWSNVTPRLPNMNISLRAANGKYLYASDENYGVLISTDNGTNWVTADSGLIKVPGAYGGQFFSINDLAISNTDLFVATDRGVLRSTNNGAIWNAAGLKDTSIISLGISGTNIFAVQYLGGVLLSTNNGSSWSAINSGHPFNSCPYFAFNETNIFAAVPYYGVFLSTDNGTSFHAMNDGLTNTVVDALVVKGSNLFVGTFSHGVWRRPLSEFIVSVDKPASDLPTHFCLEQNYPNPFNPTTTISFSLPFKSFVSLKVFDILGKEVATIVSQELPAGTYSRQWNASKMSSGVYFYRLQAGSFTQTKRLVLLK